MPRNPEEFKGQLYFSCFHGLHVTLIRGECGMRCLSQLINKLPNTIQQIICPARADFKVPSQCEWGTP